MDNEMSLLETTADIEDTSLNSSKESEIENVDAIKKFIEDQEKQANKINCEDKLFNDEKSKKIEEIKTVNEVSIDKSQEEPFEIASSVIDMILSESEARISTTSDEKDLDKQTFGSEEKGNNTMSLSVGSKVEAKDFGEFWYPAQIVEVDYDEMEVLVHYENISKKHDEWINVSSPRLRPISNFTQCSISTCESVNAEAGNASEEVNTDNKVKLKFEVGERCLAKWRDNRRFVATITNDLGNGSYNVIFDDGFQWKCTTSRLYKLKETSERTSDNLNISTSSPSTVPSVLSPISYGVGPCSMPMTLAPNVPKLPTFHTHLFDPTRDYLGSKSERREKKRKLNIKEIFNIGSKKRKKEKSPKDTTVSVQRIVKERKRRNYRKRNKMVPAGDVQIKLEKLEIPDAVASIIGTVAKPEDEIKMELKSDHESVCSTVLKTIKVEIEKKSGEENQCKEEDADFSEMDDSDPKISIDSVLEEETKLENFEAPDSSKHEEVIGRIKKVINKLEDGLNNVEKVDSPKVEIKEEIKDVKEELIEIPSNTEIVKCVVNKEQQVAVKPDIKENDEKLKKTLSKIKKSKKLRLLQEKRVKRQVEKVKSELEEMKRQVAEMKKQMLLKNRALDVPLQAQEMPESFLLPGEWCCRWVNDQPVGTVSEMECEVKGDTSGKPALRRRSVQVEDNRLPEGWTKHMVRRCLGHTAGKWDVVLVSPDNRRFHTKNEMRCYFENNPSEELKPYENALLDFGVHLKLSKRMGWVRYTGEEEPVTILSPSLMNSASPLIKRKKLSLKKQQVMIRPQEKKKRKKLVGRIPYKQKLLESPMPDSSENIVDIQSVSPTDTAEDQPLEDGYVYVGALKVQVIDNVLRCPAEGCLKNFRNNMLLQMHIKHYHRELRKMLGATPKVLDLAYARTKPSKAEMTKMKRDSKHKVIKVKFPRPPKLNIESRINIKELDSELHVDIPLNSKTDTDNIPTSQDSPQLRNALINKPVKRPKVLLPVRRPDPEVTEKGDDEVNDFIENDSKMDPPLEVVQMEHLDFETAISTHTVTKPVMEIRRKMEKKKRNFALMAKRPVSEDDEWLTMNSDVDTRSSYLGSGTPELKLDSKTLNAAASSESNEDQKENMYMYTETGERIKIVQMKREEIINCHCGYREEDGLMVQCELCLCWQHALCHNIQRESEVPEKYTCSICLNPRRGRRSKRFLHDQDRMYEGLLPGAKPSESLRRSHELSGNLLRIEDALHALRVKYYVATKKDHPKLYLWAKDWETSELSITQEKLNSGYSDLNIIINDIGKENLPIKPDDMKDMRIEESEDRFTQREGVLGSQALLSSLLASPGGGSLDISSISTTELEKLAKVVQEQEQPRLNVCAPQPEAAIENSACRERLLRHIQRCQTLIDARLDSIEAQVAELESQDPSFEDDETAEFFPRTKQTIQMLMRDLDTMEELGIVT